MALFGSMEESFLVASPEEERAWERLRSILSPKQLKEVNSGYITEQGTLGLYTIPVYPDTIFFNSKLGTGGFLKKFKTAWMHKKAIGWINFLAIIARIPRHGICLLRTMHYGPWFDAMATFILYIRSGNEVKLFTYRNNVENPY